MWQSVWIALGAIAGANSRYWLGVAVTGSVGSGFPWGTLAINLSGSLLLGLLVALLFSRPGTATWSLLLGTGFCGTYTTFSTFSYELFAMLRQGQIATALAYGGGSLACGLVATAAGYALGHALHQGN